ncbi:MAG: C13 family peptidase, partial [Myxococcota bacterium]
IRIARMPSARDRIRYGVELMSRLRSLRGAWLALRCSPWFENLRAGTELACGRAVSRERFRSTTRQLVLLCLTHLVLGLACTFVLVDGPRAFHWPGLAFQSLWLLSIPLLAYVVSLEWGRDDATFTRITVALLSPLPTCWVFFASFDLSMGGSAERRGFLHEIGLDLDFIFCAWMVLAFSAALRSTTSIPRHRATSLSATWGLLTLIAFAFIPVTTIWYTVEPETSIDAPRRPDPIDAEMILFSQASRVETEVAALLPERPGTIDLYLISVGGDATQDVFRKEASFVQALFDRRFDTAGRSILLSNHRDTLAELPIASASNLAAAIDGISRVMNPAEDILFVYLTSHGSSEPYVSIRLPDVPLNDIRPETISEALDEAEIAYPAVVISACYSGAFVSALEGPGSLVVTSAASDRRSFGCSDDADLTYFGRAFFEDALEDTRDFGLAFDRAAFLLDQWEAERDYTPSLPQFSLGERMRERLESLSTRLERESALRVARASR